MKKWFEKSEIMTEKASVLSNEELVSKLENSEGVLKFVDVSVEPSTEDIKESDGFDVPFTISTSSIDRDNDIISPDGWHLDEYMKNPVVLWAHDTSQPPVGKAEQVFVDKSTNSLKSVAKFPSKDLYEFGNMVGRMYLHGFLRGASVGFMPLEYAMDETRDGLMPMNFTKQKLLEWSAVPVPSNPDGLAQARSFGIDTTPIIGWAEKILDGEGRLVLPQHLIEKAYKQASPLKIFISKTDEVLSVEEAKEDTSKTSETVKQDTVKESVTVEVEKSVIPYVAYSPAKEDMVWDASVEEKNATPEQLYKMCTWYDKENDDTKSAYKLPHHTAGNFDVVWRGVSAAMGALMGARGGVNIPESDRRGVYDHLAKHYKQFGKEPPIFEKMTGEISDKKDGFIFNGDEENETYEIPDLKSFQAMVRELAKAEMDELGDLLGRIKNKGDK